MTTSLPGSFSEPTSPLTWPLVVAIIAAAIGSSFQLGLARGSLNTPEVFIKEWINQTSYYGRYKTYMNEGSLDLVWATIVAIFGIGGALGGFLTLIVSYTIGRRNGLILNNITAIIAATLMAAAWFTKLYELIIVARLFIGLNSGLNSGLAPMYLAEISQSEIRGAVGTIFQLFVCIGILFGEILGILSLLGGDRWWILLTFPVVLAILQLILLPLAPKSPKFLYVARGDKVGAMKALQRLRQTSNVDDDLRQLEREAEQKRADPPVSWRGLFGNRFLRSVTTIVIMMMIAQQFSAINVAILYSADIFKNAGLSNTSAAYATIGMGAVQVLMTFVSMVIVDRSGRGALLLIGYVGMCLTAVLLALSTIFSYYAEWIAYLSIAGVILFVVSSAVGPGSIPWFIVTELFTSNALGKATTAGVVTNWISTTIVCFTFPLIVHVIGGYTFFIFAGSTVLFILYIYKYVPETKGKSLDQVQRELHAMFGGKQPNYNVTVSRILDRNV